MEVWGKAESAKMDIDAQPDHRVLRQYVVHWLRQRLSDIWMTVFANDIDMRQRLIDAFPGTRGSGCFDRKAHSQYAPQSRPTTGRGQILTGRLLPQLPWQALSFTAFNHTHKKSPTGGTVGQAPWRRESRYEAASAGPSPSGRAATRRSGSGDPSRCRSCWLQPRDARPRLLQFDLVGRAFSIWIALARFWCCGRRSCWTATAMPVGRWVMRTAESVLLTCWPPAGHDRCRPEDPCRPVRSR